LVCDHPDSGHYYFDGTEVGRFGGNHARRFVKEILPVFQSFNLIDDLTVFENIELPLIAMAFPGKA
jgi:putative ABC transport system ATP-binding protein